LLLFLVCISPAFAGEATLSNGYYTVTLKEGLRVHVQRKTGEAFECTPTFTIINATANPNIKNRPAGIEHVNYSVVSWEVDPAQLRQDKVLKQVNIGAGVAGDGLDDSVLRGSVEGRTADLFSVGNTLVATASEAQIKDASIQFSFDTNPAFDLEATLSLDNDALEPVLAFVFTPKREGYYSIGFSGMPEFPQTEFDEVWQPLIWQEKRFPDRSYMTLAYQCTVPSTMVRAKGNCVALVADPRELPFEPLPVMENSRFGVALRNAQGWAQPMIFAPVLGGCGSQMEAEKPFTFRMRLVVSEGTCSDAYEQIARDIYGFSDYRHNAIASLNETINNLLNYGMSEYSQFIEELKGCSYSTDVPGAVKNVSSLSPLQMALVTDNQDIYQHRAYPLIEYMLSREEFLFSLDPKQKIQSPSRNLHGPCAPMSELTSLYRVFQKSNPVFLNLAERMYGTDRASTLDNVEEALSWRNALDLFRATGEKSYLDQALVGANAYVNRRIDHFQTDFNDPDADGLFFWTGYAPRWIDLLELYEQSGEVRYLDAAQKGARLFAMYVYLCPAIPDQDILVNKGGKAPMYWYLKGKGHEQMYCPEEEVPAWRLSEMGLTSESSGTCYGHRAFFMATYAPWMLRLGYYANDAFLSDIARSAVVGRYRNFPGYHINTARTTIYEKADYPLREHRDLSVNSFHYNHIWPMMSMLFDYLVSDVFVRSKGQIHFPGEFIEGYAYLQNKFYGHEAGEWYGAKEVHLWMPQGVLACDNIELNFLTARGDGKFFVVFTNQSREAVMATVCLNKALIGNLTGKTKRARVRLQDNAQESFPVEDGSFKVTVKAQGITSVEIDDVEIDPAFQQRILSRASATFWAPDYLEVPFGEARAMILPGVENDNAYIYLRSDDAEFRAVTLHYQQGGAWMTVQDVAFPYEFTVPLDGEAREFRFYCEGASVDGKVMRSEVAVLQRAIE
jgi:hypothetical protein